MCNLAFYCFTCKHSVCNECGVYDHKEHLLIQRDNCLNYDNTFFNEISKVIDEKGKERIKKTFPGYILVEMVMSDEAWYVVRNTPGVTGFIGSSGKGAKPTPLLPQEIDRILASMGMSRVNIEAEMQVGSKVTIVDGPFKGMTGTVDNIDLENNRLNVLIDLFGQETPVEVELFQVNKIN